MKRIVNLGKWMAVLSVGAFLFAGCLGPSSSDDAAVGPNASNLGAKFVYKMDVNPGAGTLGIEPVTAGPSTATTTSVYGGLIDVSTNGTCSAWNGTSSTCQVTITNLTPGQYISNLRAWSYNSTSATATIPNSDFGTGIEGSGLCIVEDGTYSTLATGNLVPKGCTDATNVYNYTIYTNIPLSVLHPDCGQITLDWTFGTDSTNYNFYTALVDVDAGSTTVSFNLYPEDASSDGRMDLTNRTTFVVRPYSLDIDACGANCNAAYGTYGCIGNGNAAGDGLKLGAPGCSTPLNTSVPLATGTYFAAASGLEYPDRVENQNHATLGGSFGPASCFDWLYTAMTLYTWDPAVISRVDSTTTGAGSNLSIGTRRKLFTGGNEDGDANYVNLDAGFRGSPIHNVGTNYLATKRSTDLAHQFQFGNGLESSCRADIWNFTGVANRWVANTPKEGSGIHGLATVWLNTAVTPNRCTIMDQGVDADVDQWINLQYFQVTGASGSGSRLKIEQTVNYNYATWYHSNCTRSGGFNLSDDLKGMCRPCTNTGGTGPCNGTGDGTDGNYTCDLADTDPGAILTVTGQELSNVNLPGGPNSLNGWGYQASNSHICVQ